jgi:hypothetical protein
MILTEVTLPLKGPVALVSNSIVAEGEERFAVPVKLVTLLLNVSCTTKVTCAEATPAVTVWAALVITSLFAAAGVIVSPCVAEVNVPEATVIVGVPAVVSLKKKLPVPEVIGTEITVPSNAPELLVSNRIMVEFEVRLAVPV